MIISISRRTDITAFYAGSHSARGKVCPAKSHYKIKIPFPFFDPHNREGKGGKRWG